MEIVVEETLKTKDYDYNKILENVNSKYTEIKIVKIWISMNH